MEKPSFEHLASRYCGWIRKTLLKLGVGTRDIDDVTQEVFRAVARGLPAFDPSLAARPEGAVSSWLLAICERQAANHRRRTCRRAETLRETAELDGLAGTSPTPEACLLACERQARLYQVIETLQSDRRAVLVAHELHGIAMDDVATSLGIPVNTAWNRLRLAREAIRAAWEPRPPKTTARTAPAPRSTATASAR